jgi:hypothetical protein
VLGGTALRWPTPRRRLSEFDSQPPPPSSDTRKEEKQNKFTADQADLFLSDTKNRLATTGIENDRRIALAEREATQRQEDTAEVPEANGLSAKTAATVSRNKTEREPLNFV